MRKHFIDNLRWFTILCVLVYHVFYNYNAEGVFGSIGKFTDIQYQDAIQYILYPWFMSLLFLVSGISCRYALNTRSEKEFINSRIQKLLIPSTIGLFVFQWILGLLNSINYISSAELQKVPFFVKYLICVGSGTGPLWFIQILLPYSLICVLLHKIHPQPLKEPQLSKPLNKLLWGAGLTIGGFLLLWGAAQSQIDNPSTAQGLFNLYRPLYYIVPFLLGYYIFSLDSIQAFLQKLHLPLLILALGGTVAYTWHYFGTDYTSPSCLQSIWTSLYGWTAILALLANFKKYADKTSPLANYLTRSSYGIYIVHMTICTGISLIMIKSGLPIACIYTINIIITFAGSIGLYELLRRIPILNWCIFGIKDNKK